MINATMEPYYVPCCHGYLFYCGIICSFSPPFLLFLSLPFHSSPFPLFPLLPLFLSSSIPLLPSTPLLPSLPPPSPSLSFLSTTPLLLLPPSPPLPSFSSLPPLLSLSSLSLYSSPSLSSSPSPSLPESDPHHPSATIGIETLSEAVTHARFVGTNPASDEVVLMKILQVST